MSQLSINKFGDNLPVTSLVAFSQAAFGFGLGLLVSSAMSGSTKQKLGIGSLVGGAVVLIPLAAGVVTAVQNRPSSLRRMRKQLESIRRDTGISDNGGPF
ncbi:MAG: hypothetical protein Fur0032_04210 [Terrimicrobiaceae bacterium]